MRLEKRDIVEEVLKLKEQPGKDIIKYGTGSLDRVSFIELNRGAEKNQ